MNDRAFVIAGDRAAVIANDVSDRRYRATVHYVPVGVQVPARSHADAEMQFMLEDGMLEFMVGGASACIMAPNFVRVPAGVSYAYRNAGDETARLLVRTQKPGPTHAIIGPCVDHAA